MLPGVEVKGQSQAEGVGVGWGLSPQLVGGHFLTSLPCLPLLIRTAVPRDQGPAQVPSLNYLVQGPVSKYNCIGGQNFSVWILTGSQSSPQWKVMLAEELDLGDCSSKTSHSFDLPCGIGKCFKHWGYEQKTSKGSWVGCGASSKATALGGWWQRLSLLFFIIFGVAGH